ncbi:MAG TPA: hypothetical protein VMV44_07085 [Rectinemataceae bacterium]|nr:hypothetical protein [Rectinemataceae bacterium]
MKLSSRITLNLRVKELARLKTDYGIHERKNREALIAFLRDPAKMEGIDIDEATGALRAPPIFVAARLGDYELFSLLQALGSSKDLRYEGLTLYDAICAWPRKLAFFEYLEREGFDFTKETKWGTLPLLPLVASLALEEIKDSNNETNYYDSLLEIYEFFRGRGTDLNEGGEGKIRPLMIAACANSLAVVKKLKADGAEAKRRGFVAEIGKEVDSVEYYRHKTGLGEIEERKEILHELESP